MNAASPLEPPTLGYELRHASVYFARLRQELTELGGLLPVYMATLADWAKRHVDRLGSKLREPQDWHKLGGRNKG